MPAERVSLRDAINRKCRDCIYDPRSGLGTWREQVAGCTVARCALWPVRPAPKTGPLANPPRDPATVGRDWIKGCANGQDDASPR